MPRNAAAAAGVSPPCPLAPPRSRPLSEPVMIDAAPKTRHHGFDALRASMMVLGVLLHASQFYMFFGGEDPNFAFQDSRPTRAADAILLGIHTFRMQVFFVMSGFFAALLLDRRGLDEMMRNRFHRVVLPLIFGWFVLFPPTITAFIAGAAQHAGYPPFEAIRTWWTSGRFAWVPDGGRLANVFLIQPFHLWFLYLLCWFYAASSVAVLIGRVGRGAVGRFVNGVYRFLWTTRLILPVSIGLSFLTCMIHPAGLFSQEFPLFFPNPLAMLGFGPFYGFGWLLYRNRDYLARFQKWPVIALSLGAVAVLTFFYLGAVRGLVPGDGFARAKFRVAAIGSVIPWLATVGLIGLFLRRFDRPSALVRYLSDSAYWVYLAHLPLVYGLQALFFPLPIPGLAKMALVLLVAVPVLYVSYELFVRSTFLGQALNGRRYPRAWLFLPADAVPSHAPGPHKAGIDSALDPVATATASDDRIRA